MDPSSPKNFISTKEASKFCGYCSDYIARLARQGKVEAQQIGRAWFVEKEALIAYFADQAAVNEKRLQELARVRVEAYRASRVPTLSIAAEKTLPPADPEPEVVSVSPSEVSEAAQISPVPIFMPHQADEINVVSVISGVPVRLAVYPLQSATPLFKAFAFGIALLVVSAGALASQSYFFNKGAVQVGVYGNALAEKTRELAGIVKQDMTSHVHRAQETLFAATANFSENTTPSQASSTPTFSVFSNRHSSGYASQSSVPQIGYSGSSTYERAGILKHSDLVDVLHYAYLADVAFGDGIVEATHAAIGADVAFAYGVADLSPRIAQISLSSLRSLGSMTLNQTALAIMSLKQGLHTGSPIERFGVSVLAYPYRAFDVAAKSSANSIGARNVSLHPTSEIASAYNAISGMSSQMSDMINHVLERIAEYVSGIGSTNYFASNVHASLTQSAGLLGSAHVGVAAAYLALATTTNQNITPSNEGSTTTSEGSSLPAVEGGQLISPIAVTVPITDSHVAYGDLVSYDASNGTFALTKSVDDSSVFGVVVDDPPVVLFSEPSSKTPVVQSGSVLVNVTLQNGPIEPGDGIVSSSLPGMGMRADSQDQHIVGIAREAFTGDGTTTAISLNGKSIAAGTIVVSVGNLIGSGTGTPAISEENSEKESCTAGKFLCNLLHKVNAAPLVSLMRYLLAAAIALGSLYLAFRSFMENAVNGVISIGRNPRAKTAIQAMIVLNAVVAGIVVIVGLAIALTVLLIQI